MEAKDIENEVIRIVATTHIPPSMQAKLILEVLASHGYVRLAEDQSLPASTYGMDTRTMINMQGLGWRKVELDK